VSAWRWACLACNDTWSSTSPAAHKCDCPLEQRENLLEVWTTLVSYADAMRGKSRAAIRAAIARPVSRATLVEWLGASWDPAGDDGSRMPVHKPREAAA